MDLHTLPDGADADADVADAGEGSMASSRDPPHGAELTYLFVCHVVEDQHIEQEIAGQIRLTENENQSPNPVAHVKIKKFASE
jgi:hypothetical protein